MKTFVRKPHTVKAQLYTQEMQDKFIALGRNEEENPIPVGLESVPKARFNWNWYTNKLELLVIGSSYSVSIPVCVGDYIVEENGTFRVCSPGPFLTKYQEVNENENENEKKLEICDLLTQSMGGTNPKIRAITHKYFRTKEVLYGAKIKFIPENGKNRIK